MAYILNIDTATDFASVCISADGTILAMEQNATQQQHASFLQPAIQKMTKTTGISLSMLDAVSVSAGPGSYTGLRVGMASAKGICYALQKPLITINTLQVMAYAAREANTDADTFFYCPMIDARRMEVFTAVYNASLEPVWEPQAMIPTEESFETLFRQGFICFSGNGCEKLKPILSKPHARFSEAQHHAGHLAALSHESLTRQAFAEIAYAEPFYVKAFFDTRKS
jgi:tRNA threonylcarbamoyladenosine biosynthesis protein TsaB